MVNSFLEKYFETIVNKKQLSHAFLIEVDDDYDTSNSISIIKKLLKQEYEYSDSDDYSFVLSLIDKGIYDDLKIIKPIGKQIKKEQIHELMLEYNKKSIRNKNRYYIIEYAEDLNLFAANAMLKFLEEPEQPIIGILVTKNINKVLDTIVSRCHIINTNFNEKKIYDIDLIDKYMEYLLILEQKNRKSIPYLTELYSFKNDELKNVFDIWISIYSDIIDVKFNKKDIRSYQNKEDLLSKISWERIISRIKILTDAVEMLKYNVNTRVILDKVIIGDD